MDSRELSFYLTNLIFVRHAHSNYSPDELGRNLSEKGFIDAGRVTDILKRYEIDNVVSSPYKRAIQTVEGIAESLGKEIKVMEDFKERILSIEPVEDFPLAISKVWEDKNFSWIGGESNKEAQTRGIKATIKILNELKGKTVVIGTHGNLMTLIMNYFDHRYDFTFWKNLDMPDIYQLTFEEFKLKKIKRLWKEETL